MKILSTLGVALWLALVLPVHAAGKWVQTPYQPPKVMFEFYFDDPQKIGSALFWVRALMNPLTEAPYNYPPEDFSIVVVIHGTEIVTVAKKNEAKYQEVVDRMRYYADLGVKFKVCGQAAEDFGYAVKDFQDFIEVVPNAITELAHWQQQGYALIVPNIMSKKIDIESIR
ncbi:MAG: DsrE family protein [Thiobacillus sp.]|nr:DsrE family protein [Thiobacillus sp.]